MAENNSVVCYLTNGYRGSGKEKYKEKLPEIRKKESVSALRLLNAEAAFFFGLGNIITMENKKRAIDRLVVVMKHYKPKKIYVTSPFERHTTHKVATAITIRAVRIAKLKPELWGYEVWDKIRKKTVDIDITDVKEKKLADIKCHKTQSMVIELTIKKHPKTNRLTALCRAVFQPSSRWAYPASRRTTTCRWGSFSNRRDAHPDPGADGWTGLSLC